MSALLPWIKSILFLFPLWWVGFVIGRRISSTKRIEVLLSVALILGVSLYIFLVNIISYLIPPRIAIYTVYILTVIGAVFMSRRMKSDKLSFPNIRGVFVTFSFFLIWGIFLFWKVGHSVIGSDVNLYYSIAETFTKGNFPIMSPWQPDLLVKYHYGASIFLGAMKEFTGIRYDFLHHIISFFSILTIVSLLTFISKRHTSFVSLTFYQIVPLIAIISFGTFMFIWPISFIKPPLDVNLKEIILWGRELPSVHIVYETYGATISIDNLIYFLFQSLGASLFFVIIFLSFKPTKIDKNKPLYFLVLGTALSSLALVNESLYLPAIATIFISILVNEIVNKSLKRNFKKIIVFGTLSLLATLLQGGVITDSLIKNTHSSVIFFPNLLTHPTIVGYHISQQSSHLLPINDKWLPFRWHHVGFLSLCFIAIASFLYLLYRRQKNILLILGLLISAIISSMAYNVIVPKFLPANGNRLMANAYQLLGVGLGLTFIFIVEEFFRKRKFFLSTLILIFILYISVPSIVPPLFQLSKTRFGENKLAVYSPEILDSTSMWLQKNTTYDERVLNLDKDAPFSSGYLDSLVKIGSLTPLFSSTYRAYTLEASPEYIDLVTTLNPSLLREFKIKYLNISSDFLEKMPDLRKKELTNEKYFSLVYEDKNDKNDKNDKKNIYEIKSIFFEEGEEMGETFKELVQQIPKESDIFINDPVNVNPYYHYRKALIFALRDYEPYLVWGPGAYLNVETFIFTKTPDKITNLDYLVLFNGVNPSDICKCEAERVWSGLKNNIILWRVENFKEMILLNG